MGIEEALEDLISIILVDKVFARDFHQKVMMRIHRYGAKKLMKITVISGNNLRLCCYKPKSCGTKINKKGKDT